MGTYIFIFLVGAACIVTYFNLRKKRREQKINQMFAPYLTEEIWFATGNNMDVYDIESGARYIEAEFARASRGLGQIAPDENVKIRIPNIGWKSPRHLEAYRIRMRCPIDPVAPHHKNIGCYLFAESCGWTLAVR